ncbi:GNAT family N-acetyltransferase [bacterium]|nr:MAG: GNAT family N-acetyltransferase [bacterium]
MKTLSPHPAECIRCFVDKKGAEIEIRPLRLGDEELLGDFYLNLSDETIYSFYNFCANKTALVKKETLVRMCDEKNGLRLAAIYKGKIIGVGGLLGYFCPEEVCEIAYLVSDKYQKRGIGSVLMEMLIDYATKCRSEGWIYAQTSLCNAGSKKLLKKFGFEVKCIGDWGIEWLYKVR